MAELLQKTAFNDCSYSKHSETTLYTFHPMCLHTENHACYKTFHIGLH